MKILLIGLGGMGKNHLRVLSENPAVQTLYIFDVNSEVVNNYADSDPKMSAIHDLDNFIDSEESNNINGIVIASATSSHNLVFSKIASLQKPTFIEKPLAASLREAEQMVSESKKYNIDVMVGHVERYNPVIKHLAEILSEDFLGSIYHINTQRVGGSPINKMKAGGVIFDLAVHDFDILQFILGIDLEFLYAHGHYSESISSATIALKSGDINCDVHVNWLTPVKSRKITIMGENGMLVGDLIMQEIKYYPLNEELLQQESQQNLLSFFEFSEISKNSGVCMINLKKNEPLKIELDDFIMLISGDIDAMTSLPTIHDGFKAVKIAQMAEQKIKL
tara:strand:- start:320 stop:1324 length:1005 start_codon:yes stop_codon:yes gene_type:complete